MLTKVITVYGDKLYIKSEELEAAKAKGRSLIKLYRKDGKELNFPGYRDRGQLLHIENIAP